MYFVLFATLLFLQPVFPQECRQVTVCNETPREMIKGDKGDTGNAGKAGPEGKRGETGSKGIKGERGLQGESCALGSLGTNIINKLAGKLKYDPKKFCEMTFFLTFAIKYVFLQWKEIAKKFMKEAEFKFKDFITIQLFSILKLMKKFEMLMQ